MLENTFIMLLIRKRSSGYLKASRLKKSEILSQLENDTGRSRKSLIRSLNSCNGKPVAGPGRPRKYDQQSLNLIDLVWQYNDYIAAERFQSNIADTLVDLAAEHELQYFDQNTIQLVRVIPLGTLKNQLRRLPKPGKRVNHSGAAELKKQVPIRTGFKPNISYGFLAIDFVEHSGSNGSGRFARTLCAVDPKTTWLARAACLGKDRPVVEAAAELISVKVPYKIKGMHSDNEANLLYTTLRRKARDQHFMVTRSRPYRKEDNGHVEQKNGDKIRGLVGYGRYDELRQVAILNEIYAVDDLYQNHFIPSMRLLAKQYNELGKLVNKTYSGAQTPYQRTMSDNQISLKNKLDLCSEHKKLNRVKLKKLRDKLLLKLLSSR